MIVTTSPFIEGHPVAHYLGIVAGETVEGINMFRDIGAGIRNIVGGRSQGYEMSVRGAREIAINEMAQRAQELGAHAVIGVSIDYENLGQGGMVMISAIGTAVMLQG